MICPFCNKELPDGSAFCGFCGNKLTGVAPVEESVQEVEKITESVENTASAAVEETAAAVEEVKEAAAAVEENVAAVEEKASEAAAETAAAVENTAAAVEEKAAEAVGAVEEAAATVPENAPQAAGAGIAAVADAVGENVPEATAPAADGAAKSFDFMALIKDKRFIICAAAVLAAIIVICIGAGIAAAAANASPIKGVYSTAGSASDYSVLYNGKVVGTDFSGSARVRAESADGKKALLTDKKDLYYMSNGKITEICDDLTNANVLLSANGNTAVFISDGDLCVYSGGKLNKVMELNNASKATFAVSPDGKTVVFSDYDDGTYRAYAWKGGNKAIDLDAKGAVAAVSNGGKMIYAADEKSGKLTYMKGMKGSFEKLDECDTIVAMSSDFNKILYSNKSGLFYFDSSLKDSIKVAKNFSSLIVPSDTTSVTCVFGSAYLIDNFKSLYVRDSYSGYNIHKYTRKGKEYEKGDKIASDVRRASLSTDDNSFVFVNRDDELIKVSGSKPDKKTVIDEDVDTYRADSALKFVYYTDDDGDLRYGTKKTKIASDVKSFVVNDSGVCVFFDDDGELYYSVKGGDKKKLSISDVESVSINVMDIVYVVADDELYVSTNGKKFTKTGVEV
ncbi:MAG: hypothetical protein J1F09_03035 [Oscillospiraceae bacterium]|nr:hypothetical protein [Oscillospiraceae bacterium]